MAPVQQSAPALTPTTPEQRIWEGCARAAGLGYHYHPRHAEPALGAAPGEGLPLGSRQAGPVPLPSGAASAPSSASPPTNRADPDCFHAHADTPRLRTRPGTLLRARRSHLSCGQAARRAYTRALIPTGGPFLRAWAPSATRAAAALCSHVLRTPAGLGPRGRQAASQTDAHP